MFQYFKKISIKKINLLLFFFIGGFFITFFSVSPVGAVVELPDYTSIYNNVDFYVPFSSSSAPDVIGDKTYIANNLTYSVIDGSFYEGVYFNGTNSGLTYSHSGYIGYDEGLGSTLNFSLFMTIRTTAVDVRFAQIWNGIGGFVFYSTGDKLHMIINNCAGYTFTDGTHSFNDGLLHTIGFTYEDGVGVQMYFDGVPDGNLGVLTNYICGDLETPLQFGLTESGQSVFTGSMDEIFYTNELLSPSDIQAYYLANNGVTLTSIAFDFPYENLAVNNSIWNDWNLSIDLGSDVEDFARVIVYAEDSISHQSIDRDYIATSTDPMTWAVNRSANFYEGEVTAYAVLQTAVSSSTCLVQTGTGCLWTELDNTGVLTFISSSTGLEIFDTGNFGFIPATSSISMFIFGTEDMHDKACTVEEWASANWWTNFTCQGKYAFFTVANESLKLASSTFAIAKKQVLGIFPFSVALSIHDSWNKSATTAFPSDLAFFNVIDSEGNMYVNLPYTDNARMLLFGRALFLGQSSETDNWYRNIRVFSKYALYMIFITGLVYRGKYLFKEATSDNT